MGIHHIAFATKDATATHEFYTEVMGFRLVKVAAGATPGGGWSKHFFFDTGGGGEIAFWDIRDESIGGGYKTDLSTSLGLPPWVNHLAFDAPSVEALDEIRDRWLSLGMVVPEVDHDFCRSIYTSDPNGIMVEFCVTLRPYTAEEQAEAESLLLNPQPLLEGEPRVTLHKPPKPPQPVGAEA